MFGRTTQRFTKPARTVVQHAVVRVDDEAGGKGEGQVRAADLLLAILDDAQCLASRVLVQHGVGLSELAADVARRRERHVEGLEKEDAEALATIGIDLGEVMRHLERPRATRRRGSRFSPSARQALELSLREAIALRHNYIGTEHILLGLVRGGDAVVAESLRDEGVSYEALRDGVRASLRRAG